MSITRAHVQATVAVHDAAALRAILDAARVNPRGAETEGELAARIADALWWNYCTPLGYVADRTSLEDIVAHVADKLGVPESIDPGQDAWTQLRTLTAALFEQIPEAGVSLSDLDAKTRVKAWPSWRPLLALGSGASGSFGASWASARLLAFLRGPIGRLLPLIPPIAPWVGAIRTGAAAVNMVAGPLGVALSILTVNQALGTNYHRLVPLLLGVGALGPTGVVDAEEIGG